MPKLVSNGALRRIRSLRSVMDSTRIWTSTPGDAHTGAQWSSNVCESRTASLMLVKLRQLLVGRMGCNVCYKRRENIIPGTSENRGAALLIFRARSPWFRLCGPARMRREAHSKGRLEPHRKRRMTWFQCSQEKFRVRCEQGEIRKCL